MADDLSLSDLWPDEGNVSDLGSGRLMSARKIPKPSPDRPRCSQCAGELVRSRIRAYERPLTILIKTRPYRCLDCLARQWR